ncbi:hypothetical protein [Streptomyces europaeiscabiei]|nr:hypothetical protein [Streptomyces europaeiscabiei]
MLTDCAVGGRARDDDIGYLPRLLLRGLRERIVTTAFSALREHRPVR